jgi:hypothetical protein
MTGQAMNEPDDKDDGEAARLFKLAADQGTQRRRSASAISTGTAVAVFRRMIAPLQARRRPGKRRAAVQSRGLLLAGPWQAAEERSRLEPAKPEDQPPDDDDRNKYGAGRLDPSAGDQAQKTPKHPIGDALVPVPSKAAYELLMEGHRSFLYLSRRW